MSVISDLLQKYPTMKSEAAPVNSSNNQNNSKTIYTGKSGTRYNVDFQPYKNGVMANYTPIGNKKINQKDFQ